MAIGLEITKRVECLYFGKTRHDVSKFLERVGEHGKEIVPLWRGMSFAGFAVMNAQQFEYFQKFMASSEFIGMYDGVKVYNYTPGTE